MAAPRFHQHDVGGEPQDFIEIVGDVHHRNGQMVAQGFEVGKHFLAPRAIERRQRFIEQQEPRLGQQCAADGDSLPFASGQLVSASAHQRPRSSRPVTVSRLT